jgi:hypothetical protein
MRRFLAAQKSNAFLDAPAEQIKNNKYLAFVNSRAEG